MAFTSAPIITDEGAAFLATIIGNSGTINFNAVKFSATNYVGSETTLTAGTFSGDFITATPSASKVGTATINVASSFNNSSLTTDKNLYSIGVLADDGNGNTALICVCTTSDPDVISRFTGTASTYAYDINLGVSSTENITVTGSVAGALYISDIEDSLTSTATNKPLSANQGKALSDAKQNKTLSAPIEIGGVSQTTVEGALNGLATNSGGGGRNLLDNPWFTVNQRGTTSGTFSTAYNLDMWKNTAGVESTGTWTLGSSGITIDATNVSGNCYFTQAYESNLDATKVYTASIMLDDGTIISKTGTLPIADADEDAVGFTAYNYRFQWYVKPGKTATIRAVKLEVGSVSTLHLDVAPNYTEELLKCQRYFVRLNGSQYKSYGFTLAESTTVASLFVTLPTSMRAGITISSSGSFALYDGSAQKAVSALASSLYTGDSRFGAISCTSTGLTVGKMYALITTSSTSHIDLSAEL